MRMVVGRANNGTEYFTEVDAEDLAVASSDSTSFETILFDRAIAIVHDRRPRVNDVVEGERALACLLVDLPERLHLLNVASEEVVQLCVIRL